MANGTARLDKGGLSDSQARPGAEPVVLATEPSALLSGRIFRTIVRTILPKAEILPLDFAEEAVTGVA